MSLELGTLEGNLTEQRVYDGRAFSATYNSGSLASGAYAPVLICLSAGTGVVVRVTRIKFYIGTSKRVLIVQNPTLSGGSGSPYKSFAYASILNRNVGHGQSSVSFVKIPSTALTADALTSQVLDDETLAAGQYTYDRSRDPYVITGAALALVISGGSGIAASAVIEWDER
jgi:hypothetical protein